MNNSGAGEGPLKGAILIAGPTASGKSALALELARLTGGAIVNADSMQVYSVLRVLTARPSDADLAAAPHHLYGHVHPATAYSTGEWQRDVKALVASGALDGGRPIFVGGTGLYFRALLGGLADMPEVPAGVRDHWRARLTGAGPDEMHDELARRDPDMAARLRPGDGQRIVRALEVIDATGRSILDWQAGTGTPVVDRETATRIVLEPQRSMLHRRIEARFDRMVGNGALDEVRALLDLGLDPALPSLKAIGVRELGDALEGRIALPAAIERAKIATRQYCKRQSTWFRNQLGNEWLRMTEAHDIGRVHEFLDFNRG